MMNEGLRIDIPYSVGGPIMMMTMHGLENTTQDSLFVDLLRYGRNLVTYLCKFG